MISGVEQRRGVDPPVVLPTDLLMVTQEPLEFQLLVRSEVPERMPVVPRNPRPHVTHTLREFRVFRVVFN